MIIRTAFRCTTCGQDHVVRIGMGHDDRQEHRFPCRGCGEEMVVALNVDYDEMSTVPEAVENAALTEEMPEALVVNVHANYIIDGAERYVDGAFPHIKQMHAQLVAAEQFGSLVDVPPNALERNPSRPFRRPDFADEWKLLKKAWSLHQRGRETLVAKQLVAGSSEYYSDDPLQGIDDWIWRFTMFLGATKYQILLLGMMDEVKKAVADRAFAPLLEAYSSNTQERAQRYFGVIRDYFAAWSEFSQVHFAVGQGLSVPEDHVATTSGFNSVKMFYGTAFEAFASLVDLLAFMNNVLDQRDWQDFRNIDASIYQKSDKARRFDSFADRPTFNGLCDERDNRLRNASHHGELHFDSASGSLSYREGKGASGNVVVMSYAEYLSRSSTMFFQIVTLLRFELLLCNQTGTPYPV